MTIVKNIQRALKAALHSSRVIAIALPCSVLADAINDDIKILLQSRFAAAVILTDSDALEFGFASFDPNEVIDTGDDNLGSGTAIENRNNKSTYILPYEFDFGEQDQHSINSKLFYINSKNDLALVDDFDDSQQLTEHSYGGALGYSYQIPLSEHWTLYPSINTYLTYYKNSYSTDVPEAQEIEDALNSRIINTSAWALLFEPGFTLDYRLPTSWGRWHASSKWNYFNGIAWGDANDGDIGQPNGWYITNRVTGYYDLFSKKHTVFLGAKRVDLSAILQSELGAQHYYGASIGWLYNNPTRWEAIKNIGLGLNLNYGSALKGGSIVFHFNKF
jgi:hypothetical protein